MRYHLSNLSSYYVGVFLFTFQLLVSLPVFAFCQNALKLEQISVPEISYFELNNKLQVYSVNKPGHDRLSVRLIYRVGARDEQEGQTGYAHLFEHMMFKGSNNVPDGGHFRAIENIGGQLNASTDYDTTVYWNDVPREYLDRVLWLEADRMKSLDINPVNLSNQMEAVIEEKVLRVDNVPYVLPVSEFLTANWSGTGYDHLIIGKKDDLLKASVATVGAFHSKFYRPDNAVLIVVGDIAPEALKTKATHFFASIESDRQPVVRDMTFEPELQKKSDKVFDPLAPYPVFAFAWPAPGRGDDDFYTLQVISDMLLEGDESLIRKHLIEVDKKAIEVIGYPYAFELGGLVNMVFVPHVYASFDDIDSRISTHIDRLMQAGVEPELLCGAIKRRQLSILQQMQSRHGLAKLIAEGVYYFDDPYHMRTSLQTYAQLDNDTIKRVAGKYFSNTLRLEVTGSVIVSWLKAFMELMPDAFGRTLEKPFL